MEPNFEIERRNGQNQDDALDVCPHFGECGGCKSQDVTYAEQCAEKAQWLGELFADYWPEPIHVTPSPVTWYYRNKVDLTFGRKFYENPPPKDFERETVLGFKRKGRWFWPLEVSECRLASPVLVNLLAAVRGFIGEHGLKAFNSRRGDGFLKILLVREAKRTGQRMVVLITHDGEFDQQAFVDAVLAAYPADSIYWGIHRKLSDVAEAEELHLLYGAPYIEEALHVPTDQGERRLRFRISPMSFFQTNTLATELLYSKIRSWAEQYDFAKLYDLYGGSGGIAFSCADLVGEIESVESVAAAGEDGSHNAELNGIANVHFVTEKVENYLRDKRDAGQAEAGEGAILDPPRAGLNPKALRRLLQWRPGHMLYVSCKPEALAQELPAILEHYRITSAEAVDLFPHTPHVELLIGFEKK